MCAVEWESSYFHKDEKSRNATEEKTDLIPQQVSLNASAVLGSVQLGRECICCLRFGAARS